MPVARGDPSYAKVETDFVRNDPRFTFLTLAQQAIYLHFWFEGVAQRREVIVLHGGVTRYALRIRARAQDVCSAIKKLSGAGCGLIQVIDEEHIWVIGVRKKHRSLHNWHDVEDDLFREQIGKNGVPQVAERERERERESTPPSPLFGGGNDREEISSAKQARQVFEYHCAVMTDDPAKPRRWRFGVYREKIEKRLKNFSVEELKLAAEKLARSPWHRGWDPKTNGKEFCSPAFLYRSDLMVDEWLNKPDGEIDG
jgi:hypothetical protein